MSLTKASLVALGMAGAMAVGVWMAPYVTDRARFAADADADTVTMVESTPPAIERTATVETPRAVRVERETATRIAAVAPDAPELQARLKPVLARGTNVEMAANGFENAEQFATVAYLSRNTGVPFVLLKHRVLNEGHSLSDAVTMSKPDINADLEVTRAQAEARADVWSVG